MTSKKKLLKLGAALLGVLLIAGVVATVFFTMNIPGTERFAHEKMTQHLDNYYGRRGLELKDMKLGENPGEYTATAYDPENEDTWFTVTCNKNGTCEDDYDELIETGLKLMEQKALFWAKNVEYAAFDSMMYLYPNKGSEERYINAFLWQTKIPSEPPHLSPPYRNGMKPAYELLLVVDMWELEPEKVAEDLKRLYKELKNPYRDLLIECRFVDYDIAINDPENPERQFGVYNFTDEMFEAEDFIERFVASKCYYDSSFEKYIKTLPEGANPDDYSIVYLGDIFWED